MVISLCTILHSLALYEFTFSSLIAHNIFFLLLGNLSIWDDLNWVFRLHHADKIQLLVYSGSSSNHTCVGKKIQ